MRFRQVHLDFHTSGLIPGIGAEFNKKQFQNALKEGMGLKPTVRGETLTLEEFAVLSNLLIPAGKV